MAETTRLVNLLPEGGDDARNKLIAHASERLLRLARRMLREYPGVRRWEQTDDVRQNAALRLQRALSDVDVKSSKHFWHLATLQIRRELIDLARHHLGPEGHGRHHHTDGAGKAADDPGGGLHSLPYGKGEPSTPEAWIEFHELVEGLPEEQREVARLRWFGGLAHQEVANVLDMTLDTVKKRLGGGPLGTCRCVVERHAPLTAGRRRMDDTDHILDLLTRWEDEQEKGRDVPVEELCRDCPELAPVVAERIARLKKVAWIDAECPTSCVLESRYRLDAKIGEGGFGEVWRGFDLKLQRPVAVKVPKPGAVAGPERIDGMLAEAQKAAGLKHPGIVAVHDVVLHKGAYVIVSDLIDGDDLGKRLRTKSVPLREAVGMTVEVAGILHHAHEQGLVHRDVKPSNILLERNGRLLLTDFGSALTAAELRQRGDDGCGTLAYMSPEQLHGDQARIDPRSDLYNLGVVLYQLLTRRLPFESDTPEGLRDQILRQEPPPVRAMNRAVPKEVERICLKCLAKSPVNRYPSAKALAADLTRSTAKNKLGGWQAKVAFLIAGLCGVALSVLALLWTTQQQRTPPPAHAKPVGQFQQAMSLPAGEGVICLAFSPDGKRLVTGGKNHGVKVWDAEKGQVILELTGHTNVIRGVAFSPDGNRIATASGGDDNTVRVWDATKGTEIFSLKDPASDFIGVAFSPDGRKLAVGKGGDGTARVLDAETGREILTLRGHKWSVGPVCFSPDGESIATGATDWEARVWDANTGVEIGRLVGNGDWINGLCFSPDGRQLATACSDRTVRVWDLATWRESVIFRRHTAAALCVAYSPDGQVIASGGADNTVNIYEAEAKRLHSTLRVHTGAVNSVAFSRDGVLASGSDDGTVILWRMGGK